MVNAFSNNWKQQFNSKQIHIKLILINVVVFLCIKLLSVVAALFTVDFTTLFSWIQLPSYLPSLLVRPWSLVTYMFVHQGFWHLAFNMLWLYWFGQLFQLFFTAKQLLATYILGGLMGALFFVSAYNIFPLFASDVYNGLLQGASASIMSIVFGVSFYKKDFKIPFFFFSFKIYHLALVYLVLDLLSLTSANAGGHFAHLGGAVFGILYALSFQRGKDLTKQVNSLFDKLANLRKKKPNLQASFSKREKDYQYNDTKNKNNQEIDRILDKIRQTGYNNLSAEEKKQLFDASNQ